MLKLVVMHLTILDLCSNSKKALLRRNQELKYSHPFQTSPPQQIDKTMLGRYAVMGKY